MKTIVVTETVDVDVEVDLEEVLSEADNNDLIDALRDRGYYVNTGGSDDQVLREILDELMGAENLRRMIEVFQDLEQPGTRDQEIYRILRNLV